MVSEVAKLYVSAVASVAAAMLTHGSTNVFDDAVFWFRGGKDHVVSDGKLQTGEFFDDLRANDSSHANHQMSVSGYAENGEFVIEPVVFPALGTTVEHNVQSLHISDNGRENPETGDVSRYPMLVSPYSVFLNGNISNEYTIICRIKVDTLERPEWLLRIGYNGGLKRGLLLGLTNGGTARCKYVVAYRTPNSGGSNSSVSLTSVRMPTNTWCDLSVAVGSGKLRVGIAAPASLSAHGDNPTIAFGETDIWTDNCPLSTASEYLLFGEGVSTEGASARTTGFQGSVQQLAIWGRKLDDREVMAAFGMPRPAIFHIGLRNGLSNEFGGSRMGTTQVIDGLGSWRELSDSMLSGDSWTVNFDVLRDEAMLPQMFSISSLRESSPADISVSLNGTLIGVRRVNPNSHVYWPIPRNLIPSGGNVVILQRVDDNKGMFRMDDMELGGSIGVGIEDGRSSDGMVYPSRMSSGVPSAADVNPQHWPSELQTYNGISNIHFRVWVDTEARKYCSFRFRTTTRCVNRGSSAPYIISGDETFSVFVNGIEKAMHDSNTSWTPIEVGLVAEDLFDGWNDIELRSAPWGTCRWLVDFYQFEAMLTRGFSIPQPGFILSFQ